MASATDRVRAGGMAGEVGVDAGDALGDVALGGATAVADAADAIDVAGKNRAADVAGEGDMLGAATSNNMAAAADVADVATGEGGALGGKLSPLASVSATRAVLEAHGLATKHALGQNFLINDDVLKKIVQLADLGPADFVLEVGPGIGTLTIALLKNAAHVVSVERDADLPAVLEETLAPWADRFALVEKDALDLADEDLRQAAAELASPRGRVVCAGEMDSPCAASSAVLECADEAACAAGGAAAGESAGSDCLTSGASLASPNKFVANLPYAVAATLVLDYFQRFPHLQSATVMVQKEVADRMAAAPGNKNYGAYTVKLGMYARPAGRFAVGPGNFFPPPHVDSAVLRLDRCAPLDDAGEPLGAEEIAAACVMAGAAFASRRKTLANSCKTYFSGRGEAGKALALRLGELFELAGIDGKRRGETLSQAEFIRLGKAYLRMT